MYNGDIMSVSSFLSEYPSVPSDTSVPSDIQSSKLLNGFRWNLVLAVYTATFLRY